MMPMFLTVYLSNNELHFTEVPVTPETLCRDVVDLCKEPGEMDCYLAESWRGSERVIGHSERMIEVLQRWGQQRAEVRFFLRHDRVPGHESGCHRGPELPLKRNTGKMITERHTENGFAPSCMDLTLAELQEMASRQQQQISAQQQLLASKEQRLQVLKVQEQQHVSEQEKLRLLRENAQNQEAKLRRVRALRGQVEHKRISNNKLVEEIEQMSALFQQKQRELALAVVRVEELSRQLELLRSGNSNSGGGGAKPDEGGQGAWRTGELERLYRELQLRNKINQEQSARLQQQRETLSKRTQEVSTMDRRLAELRERLWRKKAALQHKENLPQPGDGQVPPPPPAPSRVAAVGPYIQSAPPLPPRQDVLVKAAYPDGTATLPKPLSKPAVLSVQTGKMGKLSDWSTGAEVSGSQRGHSSTLPRMSSHNSTERDPESDLKPPTLPLRKNQSSEDLLRDGPCIGKVPPPVPSKPKPSSGCPSAFVKSCYSAGTFQDKSRPPPSTHSQRPPMAGQHHGLPLPPKPDTLPAATVRPFSVEGQAGKGAGTPPTSHKPPPTVAASSIYSMYTQHGALAKGYQGQSTLTRSQPRLYGKPMIPSSSTAGQHSHAQDGSAHSQERSEGDQPDHAPGPTGVAGGETERTPRPLSPTKLLPFLSQSPRMQSDAELEALRKRLQHAPRPLKKRSSITEPEGPAGPNIHKLLYQKATLAAMETERSGDEEEAAAAATVVGKEEREEREEETAPLPPLPPRRPLQDEDVRVERRGLVVEEEEEEEEKEAEPRGEEYPPYPPPPYPSNGEREDDDDDEEGGMKPPEVTGQVVLPPGKRTNLRKLGSERIAHGMRVRFNPLALLLDASLEGEYDLVQRIIYEVEDPSMPNDEGITALHNAVCAGHTEIVKFLVQFGVNVNAADSDGWTPLHCAASCNNVQVCKFLVESGAAVFAATHSDLQTAADKCEELEEGYAQCSQFLYGVQEKMGVMNRGVVYALWDYDADSEDELTFREGDCMTVLQRDDSQETEWWWARCGDHEGYIPRNLLGLYLRIKPRQRSLA